MKKEPKAAIAEVKPVTAPDSVSACRSASGLLPGCRAGTGAGAEAVIAGPGGRRSRPTRSVRTVGSAPRWRCGHATQAPDRRRDGLPTAAPPRAVVAAPHRALVFWGA